ncbi:MAG: hypothetical protein FWH04_08650 [Oscillospiraceae bacterium]|nr:hypothetical protein [Oscillospiraceae bacterium]
MKTMKKLALYLLIPALLTACGTRPPDPYNNPEELGVIYQDNTGQRVAQVKPLPPGQMLPSTVHASYAPFEERTLFDGYVDFAAVGKIQEVREIQLMYDYEESTPWYGTLFDLKVDRIYYINDIEKQVKPGDTITIYVGHSSYNTNEDEPIPMLYKGDEFLVFTTLTSRIKEIGWVCDLTPFCEYAAWSPNQDFLRKNGDYYEGWWAYDGVYKDYDSQRISKQEAYGIDDRNYIAAGDHFGFDEIYINRLYGSETSMGTFKPREAVLKSPVYAELYIEYMKENSESVFYSEDEAPQDHNWIDYIDDIPQSLKDMLFEKALEKYSYTTPDILQGEYDYQRGLDVHKWNNWTEGFDPYIPEFNLYDVETFEKNLQQRIAGHTYKKYWSVENEDD